MKSLSKNYIQDIVLLPLAMYLILLSIVVPIKGDCRCYSAQILWLVLIPFAPSRFWFVIVICWALPIDFVLSFRFYGIVDLRKSHLIYKAYATFSEDQVVGCNLNSIWKLLSMLRGDKNPWKQVIYSVENPHY